MNKAIDTKIETLIESILDSAASCDPKTFVAKEGAERQVFSGEDFEDWLPLTFGTQSVFDFTLSQLKEIRNVSRNLSISNEILKNVIFHYENKIVGDGVTVEIYPEDLGQDPSKLAEATEDSTIQKMKENWKLFSTKNKLNLRLREWIKRKKRDGEVFIRIFPDADAPAIRFIDPGFVESTSDTQAPFGILFDKNDAETAKKYYVTNANGDEKSVKAEDVIHDKDRGTDMEAPRGVPAGWAVFTNLRRYDKLLVNISVVAQIQAAIALVRRHANANQARVQSFLNKTATGTRTDTVTGQSVRTKRYAAGTILDAPNGMEYDFPAHQVNSENFLRIVAQELAAIGACFVLPVEWLLSKEPTEPLSPGSPVVSNFRTEQASLFEQVEELFWKVQGMMGINVEAARLAYNIYISGPELAVAKALDEARIDEIYQRLGATSPQEIAAKIGNKWAISRSNTIKHRKTAQPGEQMPGDSGNTNTGGGDGLSKSNGGQRLSDPSGGNNKV